MVFSVAPCNWKNLHFSTAPERMKVQRLQSEAFQFQQEDMYVSMFKLDSLFPFRRANDKGVPSTSLIQKISLTNRLENKRKHKPFQWNHS